MGPRCERTHGFAVSCAVWGFHRTGHSSHTPSGDTLMTTDSQPCGPPKKSMLRLCQREGSIVNLCFDGPWWMTWNSGLIMQHA